MSLVEDDTLMRSMLCEIIGAQQGMRVAASVATVREAKELIVPGSTDVVLMDIELEDGNGVALSVQLQRRDPRLRILLLSSHNVITLVRSMQGAVPTPWSYLSKKSSLTAEILIRALAATARGQVVLDPELTRASIPRHGTELAGLTDPQLDVLRLVAQGFSNSAVARLLALSPKTVESHLTAIYRALGLDGDETNNRVSAVLTFLQQSTRP